MSDLKTGYERELHLLRRGLADFGSRNQRVAARLGVAGEHSEDMHVERMLQTAALLNARVLERLDDDVPDFTVPLLEVVYPEYLRPFPSCSIACFEPSAAVEQLSRPAVVRRGTHLTTRAGEYGFRTVYDVTLSPLSIDEAVYRLPTAVPSSVQLPESASGVISISFFVRSESVPFAAAAPDKARMFVDAPDLVTASAIDALVHRARSAFVEVDSSGRWSALDRVPVSSAGFDPDDAVIERRDGQQSAYRLLLEYFGYPQKFHFLDFHLGEVLRGRTIRRRLTIHIPVFGFHPDSPAALSLRGFEARNFRLGCSPVVNLFSCAAEPIALKDAAHPSYPMVPQKVTPAGADVWTVGSVLLTRDGDGSRHSREVRPFHSLGHYSASDATSATSPPFLDRVPAERECFAGRTDRRYYFVRDDSWGRRGSTEG